MIKKRFDVTIYSCIASESEQHKISLNSKVKVRKKNEEIDVISVFELANQACNYFIKIIGA